MKIIAYEPWYNPEHQKVLRAFAAGIPGAQVRDIRRYEPCDVAVIFGLVKKAYEPTWTKKRVLDKHQGRRLIVIESAFVRRGEYWSVGYGAASGGAADFCCDSVPDDRWLSLGIKLKPWSQRKNGPVVVMGQLPWDCNVQDTDHQRWCRNVVAELRDNGWPDVRFRPHPKFDVKKFGKTWGYGIDERIYDCRPLQAVLDDAYCVVVWNSNSGVDAVINGVPVVAYGKDARCLEVASQSVDRLHRPDRGDWLAGIGYSQWSLDEMRSGLAWRHLSRFALSR